MSESWIRLIVKYKGKCAVCGKDIPQGEYALWSRTSKAIKHVKCETMAEETPEVMELKCFVCGKNAGCAACSLEADCNRALVSQACICEQCMAEPEVYENYQQAFLAKARLKSK